MNHWDVFLSAHSRRKLSLAINIMGKTGGVRGKNRGEKITFLLQTRGIFFSSSGKISGRQRSFSQSLEVWRAQSFKNNFFFGGVTIEIKEPYDSRENMCYSCHAITKNCTVFCLHFQFVWQKKEKISCILWSEREFGRERKQNSPVFLLMAKTSKEECTFTLCFVSPQRNWPGLCFSLWRHPLFSMCPLGPDWASKKNNKRNNTSCQLPHLLFFLSGRIWLWMFKQVFFFQIGFHTGKKHCEIVKNSNGILSVTEP